MRKVIIPLLLALPLLVSGVAPGTDTDFPEKLERGPYLTVNGASLTGNPVYVLFSDKCNRCHTLYDRVLFEKPEIAFRWIPVDGHKSNQGYLAVKKSGEALHRVMNDAFVAGKEFVGKASVYDDLIQGMWIWLKVEKNQTSVSYPALFFKDASGKLRTMVGKDLDFHVLARTLGTLQEGEKPAWGPTLKVEHSWDKGKAVAWADEDTAIHALPSRDSRVIDTLRKGKGHYLGRMIVVDGKEKWLALYFFRDDSFAYVSPAGCRIEEK